MSNFTTGALTLHVAIEKFALKEPFHITGHSMVDTDVVTVTLEQGGHSGRGEASGVYYRKDDDAAGVVRQIEAIRARIEAGIDRESLQRLLPTGGARNAVDCALWDLEAKLTGWPVWQIAGLDVMVGNMVGTSLAMAPSCLLGQLCKVVDLDGPVFLSTDRDIAARYSDGFISCEDMPWGNSNHEHAQ